MEPVENYKGISNPLFLRLWFVAMKPADAAVILTGTMVLHLIFGALWLDLGFALPMAWGACKTYKRPDHYFTSLNIFVNVSDRFGIRHEDGVPAYSARVSSVKK